MVKLGLKLGILYYSLEIIIFFLDRGRVALYNKGP